MSAEIQPQETPPPTTATVIRHFGVQHPEALAMYAAMFDVVRDLRPLTVKGGK